jgi:hypothetical protein
VDALFLLTIDQPEDRTIKNSSEDALPHAIDHSNKKKKLSSPNLKIMGEEIKEHNSTPTVDDILLGSSSNSEGERTDHGKEVKVLPTIFCFFFFFFFFPKGSLVDAKLLSSLFFPLTMNSLQKLSGKVPSLMLLGMQLAAPLANVI